MAFSRTSELNRMAIMETNEEPLTIETLKSIGTTPAYTPRRAFEEELRQLQEMTHDKALELLLEEDTSENPTFDGAFDALVQWYDQNIRL